MTAIKTTPSTCRPRPHSTSRSIEIAKKDFTKTVSKCVGQLMKEYGYSRDRATTLLVRAFAGNHDDASTQQHYPSDNEIFELMKVRNLGIDDASRALVVSNAIEKATIQHGLSPVQAIDHLSSQLNTFKLLELEDRLSSLSVMDRRPSTTTRPPTSTNVIKTIKPKSVVVATPTTTTSHRSSNAALRKSKAIHKSPKTQNRKRPNPNTATSSNTMTSALTNNKSSKNMELQQQQPQQVAVGGSTNNKRHRADSITPEIEAKIAAKKAKTSSGTSANSMEESTKAAPPSVVVTSTSGSIRNVKQRANVLSSASTSNNSTISSSHPSSTSSTSSSTVNP
mmetsp:Transcript_18071/g.25051  ORF Transcript_18071/g.25051 Transcript_18071/m.25051 type:complete len:337 (-) Transcript_18071:399-1409(-)